MSRIIISLKVYDEDNPEKSVEKRLYCTEELIEDKKEEDIVKALELLVKNEGFDIRSILGKYFETHKDKKI